MKNPQPAPLPPAPLLRAGCGAPAASPAESTSEAVSTEETAPAATAARQQQGSESQGCELELFHAFLTSFYIYLSGISGRQRGRIWNPPLRRGRASHRTQAVLSQKPKNCPELTLRAEWVFLSRSGNRWRPRHGQRRAAGCRRSRPDLRSGCRRSQSSRRR